MDAFVVKLDSKGENKQIPIDKYSERASSQKNQFQLKSTSIFNLTITFINTLSIIS